MLHIIKSVQALEDAHHYSAQSDEWILIEEAVYAANPLHKAYAYLKDIPVYVLSADVSARGIKNRLSPSVKVVDYSGFVTLTSVHSQSLTWD